MFQKCLQKTNLLSANYLAQPSNTQTILCIYIQGNHDREIECDKYLKFTNHHMKLYESFNIHLLQSECEAFLTKLKLIKLSASFKVGCPQRQTDLIIKGSHCVYVCLFLIWFNVHILYTVCLHIQPFCWKLNYDNCQIIVWNLNLGSIKCYLNTSQKV